VRATADTCSLLELQPLLHKRGNAQGRATGPPAPLNFSCEQAGGPACVHAGGAQGSARQGAVPTLVPHLELCMLRMLREVCRKPTPSSPLPCRRGRGVRFDSKLRGCGLTQESSLCAGGGGSAHVLRAVWEVAKVA